jgi:hypothetical protein
MVSLALDNDPRLLSLLSLVLVYLKQLQTLKCCFNPSSTPFQGPKPAANKYWLKMSRSLNSHPQALLSWSQVHLASTTPLAPSSRIQERSTIRSRRNNACYRKRRCPANEGVPQLLRMGTINPATPPISKARLPTVGEHQNQLRVAEIKPRCVHSLPPDPSYNPNVLASLVSTSAAAWPATPGEHHNCGSVPAAMRCP